MRYAVLGGGKRFRPVLCLSAAAALGGDAAAGPALRLRPRAHPQLLARPRRPALHGRRRPPPRPPDLPPRVREDIALLAGDGLLTLAFEVMAAAAVPRRLLGAKALIILETARLAGVDGMIGGQLLDITYTAETATEEGLTELMIKKTGALIVESVRTGARIAGAKPAALKALTRYGENLGLAFQIRDDLHDAGETPRKGLPAVPNFARTFGADLARDARRPPRRGRARRPGRGRDPIARAPRPGPPIIGLNGCILR